MPEGGKIYSHQHLALKGKRKDTVLVAYCRNDGSFRVRLKKTFFHTYIHKAMFRGCLFLPQASFYLIEVASKNYL